MKRNFFTLMLVCLIMWSCKKESSKDTTDTGNKNAHKITFTVGFSKQTVGFQTNGLKVNSTDSKLTTRALADQVEVLIFGIYDASGERLKIVRQLSTDVGFGTFSEELDNGNYTVIVAAGKTGLALANDLVEGLPAQFSYGENSSLSTDVLSYNGENYGQFHPVLFDKEAFYKKVLLSIPGNAPSTVYLDRITTEVQVVVKDEIPSNARFLGFFMPRVADKFYVGNGSPAITSNVLDNLDRSFSIPLIAIGTANYTFSQPFLSLSKSDITLYCSSKNADVHEADGDISNAIIPNITCLPNQRTILTGNLFGGGGTAAGNGFHVVADTTWGGIISKPF